MKNKITLDDIYFRTAKRFEHIDRHKFEILFHGWRQQQIRKGENHQHFSVIWKRGWLSQKDALSLCTYIGLT